MQIGWPLICNVISISDLDLYHTACWGSHIIHEWLLFLHLLSIPYEAILGKSHICLMKEGRTEKLYNTRTGTYE